MINYEKQKQYLIVFKNSLSKPERVCIGIYDLSKQDFIEQAPFNKSSMKGQRYDRLLDCLINSSEILRKEKIEFIDFFLSVAQNHIEKEIAPYFEIFAKFIERTPYDGDKFLKITKKNISKEISKHNNNDYILTTDFFENLFKLKICPEFYKSYGEIFEEGYIEELYGYYRMNAKAEEAVLKTEEMFFRSYADRIRRLKINYDFTNKEILAFNRIYYFQGVQIIGQEYSIINYLNCLKKMDRPIPTGNFLINYRTVLLEYQDFLEKTVNEKFRKNQMKYNLFFENEQYEIIVPTSREELKYFGQQFNNCLNGWEWENRLSTEKYCVAIIRDKNTKKLEVCCDMDLTNLKINQYYGKKNSPIERQSFLYEFKKEYQKYLNSLIEEN